MKEPDHATQQQQCSRNTKAYQTIPKSKEPEGVMIIPIAWQLETQQAHQDRKDQETQGTTKHSRYRDNPCQTLRLGRDFIYASII